MLWPFTERGKGTDDPARGESENSLFERAVEGIRTLDLKLGEAGPGS
jgi:hypothetical protein